MKTSVLSVAVVASLAALPATAQQPVKVRVFAGGGLPLGSVDYSESRTFPLYEENATLEARYTADGGVGLEAGIEYRFTERLGVQLAVTSASRDGAVEFSGQIPHPFFFAQNRAFSGALGSVDYSETAGHLDLVLVAASGSRFDLSFFAGVSLVSVSAELLGELQIDQTYPYDEVAAGATPTLSLSDSPIGFNAGASLDYRLSERFGLGVGLRYTGASAEFAPVADSTVSIDAGGAIATIGLRLFF